MGKITIRFEIHRKIYTYTCPAGSIMTTNGSIYKKSDRGKYRFRRYLTKDCQICPLTNKCTARDHGRLIERSLHQAYVDRNDNRVRKDMWYYKKRQDIIEHIFGTIKRQWDMDHTLVNGKQNVETEYRLAAICYNLTKVVSLIGMEELKKWLKKLQKSLLSTIFNPSWSMLAHYQLNHENSNLQRISWRSVYMALSSRC